MEEEERRWYSSLKLNRSPVYNTTSASGKGAAFVKDSFSNMFQDKPRQGFTCLSMMSASSQQWGRLCMRIHMCTAVIPKVVNIGSISHIKKYSRIYVSPTD